jgi:hypothetical protein
LQRGADDEKAARRLLDPAMPQTAWISRMAPHDDAERCHRATPQVSERPARERDATNPLSCLQRAFVRMLARADEVIGAAQQLAQLIPAVAASIASPRRSTIASTTAASTMKGGASSTWSPRMPSTVPPMG